MHKKINEIYRITRFWEEFFFQDKWTLFWNINRSPYTERWRQHLNDKRKKRDDEILNEKQISLTSDCTAAKVKV